MHRGNTETHRGETQLRRLHFVCKSVTDSLTDSLTEICSYRSGAQLKSHSQNGGTDIQRISPVDLKASVLEDDPVNITTNGIAEGIVVENSSLEVDSKLTVAKDNLVFHSSIYMKSLTLKKRIPAGQDFIICIKLSYVLIRKQRLPARAC